MRADLSSNGNRAINNLGVNFGDCLVVQVEFFHSSWGITLNEDIAVFCHLIDTLLGSWVIKSQSDGLLASAGVHVKQGLSFDLGGNAAGIVTRSRTLNFINFGTVIAQHLGAERTGQVIGDVNDFQAVKNICHYDSSLQTQQW